MTDLEGVSRSLVPGDIRQPGFFIPTPEEMTDEQQAALSEARERLGAAGLHDFAVELDDAEELLPYDPERGSLGMVAYEEMINFFAPEGLKPSKDWDQIWGSLRGSSANLYREHKIWRAYQPIREREMELVELSQAIPGADEIGSDERLNRLGRIREERRKLGIERRKINPADNLPGSEPQHRPFIYIRCEGGLEPVAIEHNRRLRETSVPHTDTVLSLDDLHYNLQQTPGGGMSLQDMRASALLINLLNQRIMAVSAIETN